MIERSTDPQVIGDFRIEKRLGAGGMGVVYLARQISLGRHVALKVLGPSLTSSADVNRFRREAQAAARLKHPGIAQVYYVGQEGGICFMAMEYVEGASLRQVIGRLSEANSVEATIDSVVTVEETAESLQCMRFDVETEAFDPRDVDSAEEFPTVQAREIVATEGYIRRCCEIIRDAAIALEHARRADVVHRDIKPENLMVDREGKTYIIDFGIARFFEDRTLTHTGQLVGTPMYMSPEQVTGRIELDHRTDIYSLGLILYEMLTLRPPVTATTREGVLRWIATKPMPPVRWRNASVPPALESIVHKAISRDPDERYQTGAEFAADLKRHLDAEPVLAKPYRHKLDPREIEATRPRWLVLAAMFCFLFGLAGMMSFLSAATAIIGPLGFTVAAWVTLGVGLLMPPSALFIGFGILSGRQWARIACVLMCALIAISMTADVYVALQMLADAPLPHRAVVAALLMVPLAAGLIIWGLFTRRTADWFNYAKQIRTEFHAERKER